MSISISPVIPATVAYVAATPKELNLPALCRIEHLLPVLPIAKSTIWLWARQGRFPKPICMGAITVWKRADVLAWLERAGA